MIDSVAGSLGLFAGTFVVCFLAGLIPLINAEVYLVGVSTLIIKSPEPLPAIVVLAAAGQMTAKVLLYFTAMGALKLPTGRYQAKLESARARIERWRKRPLLILGASSLFGLPPFYVISLLAGALEIRLPAFIAIGMAGRLVRFAVIVAIPWL